jgi:hypothetical protein
MSIDPRTLDITDDQTGAFIPYPGYGGDIELPRRVSIVGSYHDATMEPTALRDLTETIQWGEPVEDELSAALEQPPVAGNAPPPARPVTRGMPKIGLSVAQYRRQNGLPALPGDEVPMATEEAAQGFPDLGPAPGPSPRMRADAAARELADNPGRRSTAMPEVSMDDVSLAGMTANLRAQMMIDARHTARNRSIDENARNPMKDELEARRTTQDLEDLTPLDRDLVGEQGAFRVDPRTGAYQNNAPAETVGAFRKRQAANLNTITGNAVMRQLNAELERIERGTSLDETGQEAPLAQPMNDAQKDAARRQAMKTAAMALQNAAGGKDYSGFFRETYDPNADLHTGGR